MHPSWRRLIAAGLLGAAGLAVAGWLLISGVAPASADPGTATGGTPGLPILSPGGAGGGGGGGGPVGPPPGGSGVPPPPPPVGGGGPGSFAAGGGGGGGGGNSGPPITTPPPNFGIPGVPATEQPAGPPISPDQLVVVFPGTLPRQVGDQFAADYNSRVVDYFQLARLNVHVFLMAVRDDVSQTLNNMLRDPRPLWVQFNSAYGTSPANSAGITPNQGSTQYALDVLHVAPVLDVTQGTGIKVAIVDSGVDASHEAFAGAHVSILDIISKPGTLLTTPTPEVHGTAIASIIVGHGRLQGIAPDVDLLAIRAFRQTDGTSGAARSSSFYLSKGISAAIEQRVRVINLSLTGPQDRLVAQTVEQALMSKIAVIAAAGNAGPGAAPAYPAAQAGVIAVTATDGKDRLYRQANRGAYVTLAAPGVDILVAKPGGYGYLSGTSMATAYVSGLSALMMARADNLTPTSLRKLLEATAIDLGVPERDPDFGAGRVDAVAAFSHLAEN